MGNEESKRKPSTSVSGNNSSSNTGISREVHHSPAKTTTSNVSHGHSTVTAPNKYTGHGSADSHTASNIACGNKTTLNMSPPCVNRDRSREYISKGIKYSDKQNPDSYNKKGQNLGHSVDKTRKTIGISNDEQCFLPHCGLVTGEQNIKTNIAGREGDVYSHNTTGGLSDKRNLGSDLLQKDVITVQEFLKMDNISTLQQKLKNLQQNRLYCDATGKKSETCEPTEQIQITQSDAVQNMIVDGVQTIALDYNSNDSKTDFHIRSDATKQSDSSSDMISEDSILKIIDKISVKIAVSSDFAKTDDLNCLYEHKLQNSVVENDHFKGSAYSDVQRELSEISVRERLNIDTNQMSDVPMVLSEKCQNKLFKETENVIIDHFKDINDFVDNLSKLAIHSVTSSIIFEIKNLSQKLNKLTLSLNKEVVKKDGTKTDFPKPTFSTSDADGQLFEQHGMVEQQCSLHCNFCKSNINKYKDVKTHINSKCSKNAENKIICEKKQDVIEESISKQEVLLHSLFDSVTEELSQHSQNNSTVKDTFCCNVYDVSFPLQKGNLNTQSNESFKINENYVSQTNNIQNKTVAPINYESLMKSVARNRKLDNDFKTGSMYYVCLPCDFVTGQQQEWKIHFLNSIHQNNTGHLKDIKTYHCLICRLCLYGDSATIIEHNMLPEHSEKLTSSCTEHQRNTADKSNDIINNLGEVSKKDVCSDAKMEYKFNNHEHLLKILFDKKYSNNGPRGYYCKPCNSYAYYSESKGLHNYTKKHKQKISNAPQSCKQFFCDSCHVYLYGDIDILSEHNAIKYHILMDNTRVIQDKYKSSLKNIPDTIVSTDNDVSDSFSRVHVNQKVKINSQGSEIRTHEKNISVLDILEIQNKSKTRNQNVSESRISYKNTESELLHLLKDSENMQNVLFDSGYKMNGYFCSPCDVSVQIRKEWSVHVKSQAHHEKMCQNENAKFKHPKFCHICKIVFICDDSAFKRHVSSVCHKTQLELNEKLQNTIEHQTYSDIAKEVKNCDNKSECDETEISNSDNAMDVLKFKVEDNMEEEDNVEDSDYLDEEDNTDEISSSVSCGLTDDIASDSHSISSVQSYEQKKYLKQTVRKEKIKQKERKKEKRNREDKPKGLHIAGLKQGTTHSQIFHALRMYGHIEHVFVKYGEKDAALVIFRRGLDADKIVRDNVRLMVNGCKLKIINTIEYESLPYYEEHHVLPDKVITFLRSEVTLRKFMDGLLKAMEDSSSIEQQKAALVINDIEELLPSCSVHPFGSRVTGIATRTSDLDLYIDIGNRMYNGDSNQEPEQQAALIRLLHDYFSSQTKNTFSDMQCIINTRVPIIKLKHNLSGLNCDISCINGLSVEKTKLISMYLQFDKRVKWLVVAIKTWAVEVKIADMTMFTTCALIWLVLFFLMQLKTPLVCSVSDLRSKNNGPSQFVAGWDCTFCRNLDLIPPSRNTESCVKLLQEFFEFYATFPFRKYVLCPLIGKALHRGVFKTVSELPPQMETYVIQVTDNPHAYSFAINTSMCLQDPFDLSQNVLKRVRGPVFRKFVTLCKESAQLCEKWK